MDQWLLLPARIAKLDILWQFYFSRKTFFFIIFSQKEIIAANLFYCCKTFAWSSATIICVTSRTSMIIDWDTAELAWPGRSYLLSIYLLSRNLRGENMPHMYFLKAQDPRYRIGELFWPRVYYHASDTIFLNHGKKRGFREKVFDNFLSPSQSVYPYAVYPQLKSSALYAHRFL